MDRITLTPLALEHQARTSQTEAAPMALPGEPVPAERPADENAPLVVDLTTGTLEVQFDKDAGRFVQTLTDPETHETLRRYPSESQLAYSRAVMAYMRALAES